MKKQEQYNIVPIEMSISLIAMIIGVGVLTIASGLATELDTTDGWISIGITGILVAFLVYLYTRLQQNFPGQNLIQYIRQGAVGKWLAKGLTVIFIIYFVSLLGFEVRILTIVVRMYLLDQTPSEMIAFIILLLSIYAVSKGTQGIIHLNIMFAPIMLVILFVIMSANIGNVEFEQIKPIMPKGIGPVATAIKETVLSFLGIEILFFFMANMKKSDLRALPLAIGIGMVTFVYMAVIVFTYWIFSLEATKLMVFPTVEMAKEVDIPGGIFERVESLMITGWTMAIFNTMIIVHLLSVQIFKDEFLTKSQGTWIPSIMAFVAFVITFIPISIVESFSLGDLIARLGMSLFILGITLGFLILWSRSRKNKSKSKEMS